MKCKHCNATIDNDSVFCEFCGARVKTDDTVVAEASLEAILKKYAYTSSCDEEGYFTMYNLYAIPEDRAKEAFADLAGIAQSNVPDAVCLLAFCYEWGIGVEANEDLASRYYFYAAEQLKSIPAIRKLGDIFYYGELGETESNRKALDYYLQIEDAEPNPEFRAEVLSDIGSIYSVGEPPELLPAPYMAEQYFAESISLDNCCYALSRLANLYIEFAGEVWPDGLTKAELIINRLEQAGKLRYDDAKELAGGFDKLRDTKYIPHAVEWYDKSIQYFISDNDEDIAGYVLFVIESIYQWGKMPISELPVPEDYKKAYQFYMAIYHKLEKNVDKYAEDSLKETMELIASLFSSLSYVADQYYSDCNYYKIKWLRLAAQKGSEKARKELEFYEREENKSHKSYYDNYVPLISEEKLFELPELKQNK